MTLELSATRGPAARSVPLVRRLVGLALTAAVLSLAGCGDSGEGLDGNTPGTGYRTRPPIQDGTPTTVTGLTR